MKGALMNTKILLPLCAAVALLAACGDRNDQSGTYSSGPNGTGTETDKIAKPGDTSTTPGGEAGDAANTTPGTNETPPAEPPPNDTPPSEPAPTNPPQ
jgi:hypothetical protein